jgi:hypothetical protein
MERWGFWVSEVGARAYSSYHQGELSPSTCMAVDLDETDISNKEEGEEE